MVQRGSIVAAICFSTGGRIKNAARCIAGRWTVLLGNPGVPLSSFFHTEQFGGSAEAILGFHFVLRGEKEEITSFQPHQADWTTYEQECVELVYLTLGTTG
jgi:hypothetical protein